MSSKIISKKNNFDSIAWIYDILTKLIFQNSIKKAQTTFLDTIPNKAIVLIIGGGTGYIVEQIINYSNPCRIVYIDSSPTMITKARQRISKLENIDYPVEFICGTEDNIPSISFDCICTHFFLDLFQQHEMDKIIQQLTSYSKENTKWYFADFQNKNSFFAKTFIKLMFTFFRYACNVSSTALPDYYKSFNQQGWLEIKSENFFHQIIKSSLLMRKD